MIQQPYKPRWVADENVEDDPNSHAQLVRMADWSSSPMTWLWEPLIPRRKVTVLVGDQEMGKSFFALDLAAKLSLGYSIPPAEPLKDGPGNVLILEGDDESDDTLHPRLRTMAADLERIYLLTVDGPKYFGDARPQISLARSIECLQRAARDIRDCRLIIIDPITAFLDGMSTNDHTRVRRLFARLTTLARVNNAAVLLITHNRKAGADNVLFRTIGSLAFTVAARVVLTLVEDPACAGRRLLLPAKMNLQASTRCPGRAFYFENGLLAWDPEPVHLRPDELQRLTAKGLATCDRVTEVAEALKAMLQKGPLPSQEIHKWAAAKRIPRTLLFEAKAKANVRAKHDGKEQQWSWEIPCLFDFP